jgi:hypothetical protein
MLAILVQLRVTTVNLVNIKKKIHNRLVKHAQRDLLKLQQPVARFVSQAPIKTQSLFANTVLQDSSSRLQGR